MDRAQNSFGPIEEQGINSIPCPSIYPKLFWTRPNLLGQVKGFAPDQRRLFTTEFHIVQNVWSTPKQGDCREETRRAYKIPISA